MLDPLTHSTLLLIQAWDSTNHTINCGTRLNLINVYINCKAHNSIVETVKGNADATTKQNKDLITSNELNSKLNMMLTEVLVCYD